MNKNTVSSLSQKEAEIVARLSYEEKDIITVSELDAYLPSGFQYRKQLVYHLKKKKILIPIKRGVYIFVPLESIPTGRRVSELLIPSFFFPKDNYYLGYSTMFNYYNFTDQQFQRIYVLNTTLCCERVILGLSYKFIKISADRMYGFEKIQIKGREVIVSSKERTLVDLIYFNKPVGGIGAAVEILKRFVRQKECDVQKFVEYAVQFPNIRTRKQIGFILEQEKVADVILKPLEASVKNTSLISFSNSRKGKKNERWGVIINDTSR